MTENSESGEGEEDGKEGERKSRFSLSHQICTKRYK